jgi:hypothetical protein
LLHNMSYRTRFILIFILHYCQHIYFLAGYLPQNIPRRLVTAACPLTWRNGTESSVQRCVSDSRYCSGSQLRLTPCYCRKHEKTKPQGPLIVPGLMDRDWRELTRKGKVINQSLPASEKAETGVDCSVGGLELYSLLHGVKSPCFTRSPIIPSKSNPSKPLRATASFA